MVKARNKKKKRPKKIPARMPKNRNLSTKIHKHKNTKRSKNKKEEYSIYCYECGHILENPIFVAGSYVCSPCYVENYC